MRNFSIWPRVVQVIAALAIAGASFQAGIHWQKRQPASDDMPETGAAAHGALSQPDPGALIAKNVRAEFNPQSALLIGANELIRYQQPVFTALVRAVHTRIPIVGLINDDEDLDLGRELLADAQLPEDAVYFLKHPLDSMWLRDFGPIFTRWTDGHVKIVDVTYDHRDERGERRRDDAFPAYLGATLGLPVERMPLVIDGGNVLSNGDGLIVTTTSVIERPENAHYSIQDIGALLQRHLGCKVWIYTKALVGEPTGHVDFFMTFLRRNLAIVGRIDPVRDPVNAAILDETAATLAAQQTSMGPLLVERIPMPPPAPDGSWRSYANILLVNGIILMPSYSDVDPALETEARELYARLMPSWEVVPIRADGLTPKRGVLHCIGIGIPGYVNVAPLLGQAEN